MENEVFGAMFIGVFALIFTVLPMIFTTFLILFAVAIGVGTMVFSIMMIVDCSNREFPEKQMWMIILIVGLLIGYGLIASLLYYFIVKKKFDDEQLTDGK